MLLHHDPPMWQAEERSASLIEKGNSDERVGAAASGLVGVVHHDGDLHPVDDVELGEQA